jgi:hypothetical protein
MSWMNTGSTGSFPRTSTVNGNVSSFVQQPQSTNMGNYGTVGGVFTSGPPPTQAAPVFTGMGGMGGAMGNGMAAGFMSQQLAGYPFTQTGRSGTVLGGQGGNFRGGGSGGGGGGVASFLSGASRATSLNGISTGSAMGMNGGINPG